jgi:spermidine synthase
MRRAIFEARHRMRGYTMNTFSRIAIATATALLLASCATSRVNNVRSSGEGDSTAAWALLDADNDGSLTVAELDQQQAMGLLQDFPNADTDHDLRISKAEWDAWWPRMTDHIIRADGTATPPFLSAP